ncbi:MAG: phage major tail protein, TP901-1 family [Methylocystis sp.]|jgi:TP901-1 family phage major tail protein|nr:phage major tail protein, TP901-1 family [Methylocystis sp.]MCA3582703.1 phage major tail protein, TP901-1 family [Methylocystis sp.]MCA3587091.1 phage major tail protein, TP901-1 family [Methylocystis sp.]MCA3592000.1 phage major tail protein, TP901-1 family [Methylocystis sp.]
MAAQRGKDMLLKVRDDTSAFVTIAGLRSRRISFDAEAVDITHAESAGRWRELLAGAGVKKATMTGSGVFKDAATDLLARQTFFDGQIRDWRVIIPDFGTIEGPFHISGLDYRGEHQGEVTFDMTLESAGALTFTAI